MNPLLIICCILWVYFLRVFKKAKTGYFYFIVGSVGLFIIMMVALQPIVLTPLTKLVASATGVVGDVTGLFETYQDYSVMFVTTPSNNAAMSLYIDYECSGIIEMMAFVSLLMFFRIYTVGQRCVIAVVGCVSIFMFNVIRIFIICMSIYFWGSDAYYVAHTIVGRILFYILSVCLYYYVFTRAHIIRQRIGGFSYARNNDDSV